MTTRLPRTVGARSTIVFAGRIRRIPQSRAAQCEMSLSCYEVNVATPSFYVLVRLWIHRDLQTEFEAYERKVSRIMARYGGVIERAIRTLRASDDWSDEPFEVHVLKFPSRDLYDAYRDDAERRSLSGERAGIIKNTYILVGTPGPTYGS